MYGVVLLLHILGATIWTGGHLVLAITILPRVLREKSPKDLLLFESAYERLGIPALIVQVLTGVYLAHRAVPDVSQWFTFATTTSSLIGTKLILLAMMIAFAIDARFRVIPQLSEKNLTVMAWHVIPVTIISVLFVVVGVSFRMNWFF